MRGDGTRAGNSRHELVGGNGAAAKADGTCRAKSRTDGGRTKTGAAHADPAAADSTARRGDIRYQHANRGNREHSDHRLA